MGAIQSMITQLNTQLNALVIPLGILGLLLWGLALIVTPVLPDWAGSMRGYFRSAMLTIGFLSFVPGIVAALAALGGGGGG